MKTISIFDCNIANLTIDETLTEIENIIIKRKYTQHVVLNAGKTVLMQENRKLKEIIQNCDLINADGQAVVWASKLLGKPLPERVTGIDLMERLIEISSIKGYSIYFFGAKENVVINVLEYYKTKYPALKIAGYRNGYFNKEDEKDIINDIKQSKADILLVAFSSPKKEIWLSEHGIKLKVPFMMGVGGSFDVIAGITKRAPNWMQKSGLEWFYRFIQEPKRMWKRYLVGNFKFIYYTFAEMKKQNRKVGG
jgi:N-acetylglucosaminyldiphosphoundecaprenol N-acetyl-beta-D-mannosaminyltransferase